jgi:hypothetical protein
LHERKGAFRAAIPFGLLARSARALKSPLKAIAAHKRANYGPPAFRRPLVLRRIGASPSGKAADFDSAIRRFESSRPSQLFQRFKKTSIIGRFGLAPIWHRGEACSGAPPCAASFCPLVARWRDRTKAIRKRREHFLLREFCCRLSFDELHR